MLDFPIGPAQKKETGSLITSQLLHRISLTSVAHAPLLSLSSELFDVTSSTGFPNKTIRLYLWPTRYADGRFSSCCCSFNLRTPQRSFNILYRILQPDSFAAGRGQVSLKACTLVSKVLTTYLLVGRVGLEPTEL